MIEPTKREESTPVASSRKKAIRLIRSGTAVLLLAASFTALYGQAPDTLNTADSKSQLSPQKQAVRRDQAYVRALLEKGSSDAKVEVSLKLTSRFTSFNSAGDFHAYAVGLISKERKPLRPAKQAQRSSGATQTASATAISVSASAPSGNVTGPSNPVGINSVKASQESSRDSAQDTTPTSTDSNQVAVSSPSPAVFGGGILLPSVSALSNGGGSVQPTSVGASSNSPVVSAASGGSSQTESSSSTTFNSDQGPGPDPIGPGPGCNLFPAPPSVGATVPLSYFGPSPSETNQSLVGPVQLLKSGTVDAAHGTITLPLYQGKLAGTNKNVWYILTDVSDSNVAAELGLNFSTKLQFSSLAARTGNLDAAGNIVFDAGTVNFAPERKVIPGPPDAEFPPKFAQPGAIGDANYGPLVRIVNAGDVIYNAPMVAFGVDASQINFPNGNVDYSKVHDEVVAIDPVNQTVTINLLNGFSFGRPVC